LPDDLCTGFPACAYKGKTAAEQVDTQWSGFDGMWHSGVKMKNIHGFYVEVDRSNGTSFCIKSRDDFSSAQYRQGDVIVFVQAGVRSVASATAIAESYRRDGGTFTPARYTEGSFLIIDSASHRVVAGRDRSQAYHLYIYVDGDKLHVTTDIAVLCGAVCKELDATAVDLYLNQGIVLAPFPLLKGVEALLPGHYRTYDTAQTGADREFWRIQTVDIPDSYDAAVERYGELFLESIRRNISGSQAAVFLSGGSDSAAVMGGLHKLGVSDVQAAHMAIKGNFPFERDDVKALQKAYGFNLHYVTPDFNASDWVDYVKQSLTLASPNSIYISLPTYMQMGRDLGGRVQAGTTVFNGEMCLLDQGFNESGDTTRNVRRWLYMQGGRNLAKMFPIWPESGTVNWAKVRKPCLIRNDWRHKRDVLRTTVQAFLHAIGRPADYYAGLKLGFRGFPGIWSGLSLLPADYSNDLRPVLMSRFFDYFKENLKGADWRRTIAAMNTCWYSEGSNFTMPTDAAGQGRMGMCFPFSSVDLMDFAASLPMEWTIDKKIQKDMCSRVLNMPDQVAYRLKNHKQSFSYFDIAYGAMKAEMEQTVRDADFGPLNQGVQALHTKEKLKDNKLIALFGLTQWINFHGLKVR
jgi:hypothetical protein